MRNSKAMRPIATYAVTAGFDIIILNIDSSSEEVTWKWSNDTVVHTSLLRDIRGVPSFRANRVWISLDDCMRA